MYGDGSIACCDVIVVHVINYYTFVRTHSLSGSETRTWGYLIYRDLQIYRLRDIIIEIQLCTNVAPILVPQTITICMHASIMSLMTFGTRQAGTSDIDNQEGLAPGILPFPGGILSDVHGSCPESDSHHCSDEFLWQHTNLFLNASIQGSDVHCMPQPIFCKSLDY